MWGALACDWRRGEAASGGVCGGGLRGKGRRRVTFDQVNVDPGVGWYKFGPKCVGLDQFWGLAYGFGLVL